MSRSIRKETSSLAFGMVGRFGGSSAGFVVAALNAASATSREVVVLRVLSTGILCPLARGFTFLNANWTAELAHLKTRTRTSHQSRNPQGQTRLTHGLGNQGTRRREAWRARRLITYQGSF